MLWVLKRTVSMRRFFRAPKTHVTIDGYENNYNFTIIKFPYLDCQSVLYLIQRHIRAMTWKNQYKDWTQSVDSDQPGYPPSLTRVFAICTLLITQDQSFLYGDSGDSDQSEQITMLI